MQPGRDAVDAVRDQLLGAGIGDIPQPGRIRDTYGFYFRLDRLLFEIGVYENG